MLLEQQRSGAQPLDSRFNYLQKPCRVEDALGRSFLWPSEFTLSDLDAVIRIRFVQGPGHEEVKRGRYEYFDVRNVQQALRPGQSAQLLPGMTIKMTILLLLLNYSDRSAAEKTCPMPGCGNADTLPQPNGERYWQVLVVLLRLH